MGKYCYCPTSFNVAMGLFLVFLSVAAFLRLWDIFIPLWLSIIILILGLLLIFLNSANPIHEKVEERDLSAEKANQIHAREGY